MDYIRKENTKIKVEPTMPQYVTHFDLWNQDCRYGICGSLQSSVVGHSSPFLSP